MAYQRVPETAEVRIVFQVQGKELSNLFYAFQSGGYNQAGLDALAAGVDTNIGPIYAAIMSINDDYVRTDVRGLDVEFDLVSTDDTNATAGSVVDKSMPRNVSFCVTQRSGLTGASAQGRTYICGIPTVHIQAGALTSSLLTVAAADAWRDVVDGTRIAIDNVGVFDPVLVSRWSDSSKRAEAVTFPWTLTEYRTLKVATRRDRLR